MPVGATSRTALKGRDGRVRRVAACVRAGQPLKAFVDVKGRWLLRATSDSRADTAVAATQRKSASSRRGRSRLSQPRSIRRASDPLAVSVGQASGDTCFFLGVYAAPIRKLLEYSSVDDVAAPS